MLSILERGATLNTDKCGNEPNVFIMNLHILSEHTRGRDILGRNAIANTVEASTATSEYMDISSRPQKSVVVLH